MVTLVPLAALALSAAAATPSSTLAEASPQAAVPSVYRPGVVDRRAVCRERIQEARQLSGKPAAPAEESADPLFIAAVDKQIGGCSVLVMRNDTSDIRDLPRPGEHRVMRAR